MKLGVDEQLKLHDSSQDFQEKFSTQASNYQLTCNYTKEIQQTFFEGCSW